MANKKISQLDDAGSISTSDEIPLARSGRTYKAKIGLSIVPAGCVMAFAGATIPEGWLKCNGDGIPNASGTVQGKTANFSVLFSIIGANLPDLRGYFVRGLDDGRNIDAGRPLRTSQDDGLLGHVHVYNDKFRAYTTYGGTHGNVSNTMIITGDDSQNKTTNGPAVFVNGAATEIGTSETRPKNVALHYIIKY